MNFPQNVFRILLLVILLLATVIACDTPKDEKETKVVGFLHEFYSHYITQCSKMPVDRQAMDALKREYCTKQLLRELDDEEMDYDIFLHAQDCDTIWLQSLEIEKSTTNDSIYVVSYLDGYVNERKYIRVLVRIQGDKFKIAGLIE